jgi:hypothetical protein
MIARPALSSIRSNVLDRFGLTSLQRQFCGGYHRPRLSRWQRLFAPLGEWFSVSVLALQNGEPLWRDKPERLHRFCRDCGEDTAQELFDEFGVGWYAQTFCCRRCGRQAMTVWPLACW